MNITYCCNPLCPKPHNPNGVTFCLSCGNRLLLGDRYGAYRIMGGGKSSKTYIGLDTHKVFDPRCVIKAFVQTDDKLHRGEKANQLMERFRQEVAQLATLSRHPQLPDLMAYFERHQQQYLVQEFVQGRTLDQQLIEDGSFDEDQVRTLLRDVLPVLQFLHAHRIIHRDIKPANLVRRSSDQSLMLVDFGAVKLVTDSALAKTGTLIGSAEYVAPEQLMGRAIFASDLYSLGVTCIHLLTGLRPFELFNEQERCWFWRSVAGPVSEEFAQILDTLLKADARERYGSAQAVWQALGEPRPMPDPLQRLDVAKRPDLPSGVRIGGDEPLGTVMVVPHRWRCQHRLNVGTAVNAIAFTPDRSILLSGSNDGQIHWWDWQQETCVQTVQAHRQAITTLCISPDGRWLVSGSRDHTLTAWDLHTGNCLHSFIGHRDMVTCTVINPASSILISGGRDRTLRLWDLPTGKLLQEWIDHSQSIECLALGSDGETLVSGDAAGWVKVWHLSHRELLRTLSGHRGEVSAIALTLKNPLGDDPLLITGSWDMTVQLRHLSTGAIYQRLVGHYLPVSAIALSPLPANAPGDRQPILVTGSQDQTIKLWSLSEGSLLQTLAGHTAAVECLVFGEQPGAMGEPSMGIIASGSQDGTICLWDRQL